MTLMCTPEHKKQIVSLCSALEIPLSLRDPASKENYTWDGESLAVNDWKLTSSNIMHEVAHWLIADVERRSIPDFGLGTGPESGKFSRSITDDPGIEESRASVLGILYERALGWNWKRTFHWHCWDQEDHSIFIRHYQWLREKGYVTWGGRPTVMPCID